MRRTLHALSRFASAGSLDRLHRRRALSPHPLKIVELAHFGSEHVNDHVAGIDQHPVAVGQALDVNAFDTGFLETFGDIFRDRADVPVGPARGARILQSGKIVDAQPGGAAGGLSG